MRGVVKGTRRSSSRLLLLALVLGASGFVLPLLTRFEPFNTALYLLATSLLTFDLADVAARAWIGRSASVRQAARGIRPSALRHVALQPYAIIISVHDIRPEADDIFELLAPYKARTWFVDDCSSDDTALYLRFNGWHCLASSANLKKPAALKTLLERLPADVKTVVVLDPDSAPLDSGRFDVSDLEQAVRRFQHGGAAACCPRIRIREDGPMVSFQLFECELVFALGRKGMSPHCITSGVSIYDRDSLQSALDEHSLSVYAEDLENSLILLARGFDIHYDDDLTVETDGKASFAGWFSQRVGWSFGLLRVCASRWREMLRVASRSPWSFYNIAVYVGLMSVALYPVKAAGIIVLSLSFLNAFDTVLGTDLIPDTALTNPAYFASTYATYTLLAACMAAYLRPRARLSTLLMAVSFYLFYAMANAAAMGVGYLNWFSIRLTGRRVFRDHYTTVDSHLGPAPVESRGT